MNSSRRKIGIRRTYRQRPVQQVVAVYMVRDIHDVEFGVDLQQNALQGSDEVIVRTVIGGKCDDWIGHFFSAPGEFAGRNIVQRAAPCLIRRYRSDLYASRNDARTAVQAATAV